MAYRYTPLTHNDPTVTASTYADLMAKVRERYKGSTVDHKPNDYGEGWLKVDGRSAGYVDQGPLIRG